MTNIKNIIEEIDLHVKRIEAILPDIKNWIPLINEDFEDTKK